MIEALRTSARAKIALVVLDACRDTPLKIPGGRSFGGGKGLAPPPHAEGVLSIYSAGVGQIALDERRRQEEGSAGHFSTSEYIGTIKAITTIIDYNKGILPGYILNILLKMGDIVLGCSQLSIHRLPYLLSADDGVSRYDRHEARSGTSAYQINHQ